MDEKHKSILQKKYKFLVNNMVNVGDVCDYLLEKDIIQLSKKEEIMKQKPVPHGQIRHLLSHITRCGPKAFDALMYGLSDSGNQYLVDELIGPQKTKVPRSQKVPIPTEEEPKLPTKDEPMAQAKGEPNSNEEQELAWPLETDMVKEIQKCNVDDPKLQLQGTSVYSMTAAPKKGKVLMFKNYCLSDKKNDLSKMRQNIDTDSTNVDQVFKLANFTTKAFKDRTKEVDKCLWNASYKDSSGVEINRRVAHVNIITKCDSKQLYFFPGIQGQPATPTTKSGIQCQPTSPVPTSEGEIQSSEVSSTTVDKDMGQSENQMKGDNCGETCTETNDKVGQSYSDINNNFDYIATEDCLFLDN
ncbi:hypothetical protein KUTeg_016348 [Tegillarca granosa]|uniref:CARD domain-containing protein n=1 Tax=Tegillarca granosa TaxID=220873 RepID=A0ABQ9ER93_TEGGR|nr:hypothetical protein KUTeg_016348 [Tegillarca granosa]